MSRVAELVSAADRVVIKVGSTLLLDGEGRFRAGWLRSFIGEIAAQDGETVLVSSGATGCGRNVLGFHTRDLSLEEEQAAAAVGQVEVMSRYSRELANHDLTAAQVLLTVEDTEQRRRYLNAHNTLVTLLRQRVVPIINENDTVSTTELRYGDNDRLAARVAAMVSADVLIILSNVDGLYRGDPRGGGANAEHIAEVECITPSIMAYASKGRSRFSRGGMRTKLEAARMATAAGTHVVIADGTGSSSLTDLKRGARCTLFCATVSPKQARKRWIAAHPDPRGVVVIDDGAAAALARLVSLLPAGVTAVRGDFERGDPVSIVSNAGTRLGVGLSAYSSTEARRIVGMRSDQVAAALGYPSRAAFVHRDNLVLL